MCGIFGIISHSLVDREELFQLACHSEQRGKDASGFCLSRGCDYEIYRSNAPVTLLLSEVNLESVSFVMGHSRLATNGLADNQPIYRDDICVIHNGIVVNHDKLWVQINKERFQETDTEIIAAIADQHLGDGGSVADISKAVLGLCQGVVACAIALPRLGKLCLFSNNGSLYYGQSANISYFASEKYPLTELLNCNHVIQVNRKGLIIDIPTLLNDISTAEVHRRTTNLIPKSILRKSEENQLKYPPYKGPRCTRCILPATMPFISFDDSGVCNYCRNYRPKNLPKPLHQLEELLEPYRRSHGADCIVPFSGGRDSCFGLHIVTKVLKMKPIAYTYDWGMVSDLGRRNISRMCAHLGVENIIVAAHIARKRQNIAKNLQAWLKSPHLGMVSILTAGDKHFFRHVETVKRQTGISLNLWGVNPLEVTYFKAGFLGIPPDFEEKRVYSHGGLKQLRYQAFRFGAMLQSPRYFNSSLWDTLSGEYYRSLRKKNDYLHIFDYYRWDENEIDSTLINHYDWETAPDTNTTWRIGDGTAAFYNYIYYTVAGFTEHDTFRSNQIREGDLTREQALALVADENRPRYPNIKWYLDAIGMEFDEVIPVINAIRPLYDH
jgi:glucosamine--fructose-6-phosphate aminotransferase (isomerizing)